MNAMSPTELREHIEIHEKLLKTEVGRCEPDRSTIEANLVELRARLIAVEARDITPDERRRAELELHRAKLAAAWEADPATGRGWSRGSGLF